LRRDILNAETLRMDELFQKYAIVKSRRVEAFGKRLNAIMAELDKRDMTDVPTASLLALALKYRESLKTEYQPLRIQGGDRPVGDLASLMTLLDTWPI